MYDSVKIVRFKDGLDVISNVHRTYGMDEKPNGKVELSFPMMFQVRNSHLVLEQWLPLAVMQGDTVTIESNEILCEMNPNSEFAEYYVETIRKLKRALRQEKEEPRDEEELNEMLMAMVELETANVAIH